MLLGQLRSFSGPTGSTRSFFAHQLGRVVGARLRASVGGSRRVAVLALVEPDERFRDSFLAAEREFAEVGGLRIAERYTELLADFSAYVSHLRADKGLAPAEQPGWVPDSVFWLVHGNTFIGRVNLRHRLTAQLRRRGGHIGYEIRPSMRRRGYGTQALALTLPCARAIGLRRVLLTCDEDNVASRRVIEVNGGLLEGISQVRGWPKRVCRYWIDLRAARDDTKGSEPPRVW
jgi:predicted acetyltransferase